MTAGLDEAPRTVHAGVALRRGVDFDRPVVPLLGLPFDAIDLTQAVRRIRDAAFGGERCFVSTPNLNFAVTARGDAAFRDSVLRSDLSLVDGMPLVWVARLTGLPVPERVSGADVFDALLAHPGPPVTAFLFGGPAGAGALASEAINRRGGGLRCVGYDEAGFGDTESMSTADHIDRINASGAQFVVASLGARKGQAWIERNAGRLHAPVLSHLGAVMNFAAGTVRRAPRWLQVGGLEWLWRIAQEPTLWRRYGHDGAVAAGLMFRHVLPDAIAGRLRRAAGGDAGFAPRIEADRTPTRHLVRPLGDWRQTAGDAALREALTRCADERAALVIDLSGATAVGPTLIALLLVARGWFDRHGGLEIVGVGPALHATLRRKLVAEALLGARR